jgi:hypothetical protein
LHEAWFDLALLCKFARRWAEALEYGLRAAELVGVSEGEPAWWNLGIAATALREWDVARRAWASFGLEMPSGSGPIEADFGFAPVRLNPEGATEIVWGHRIDPARVRVMSIPFPDSGHRWGDIVLHDGVPNGYRAWNGEDRPVFDELMRWEASDVPTTRVSVSANAPGELEELLDSMDAAGYAAEDWTRNVRLLCRRCSEGIVHPEHSEAALASGREHLLGLAAPVDVVTDLLSRWAATPGRVIHSVDGGRD